MYRFKYIYNCSHFILLSSLHCKIPQYNNYWFIPAAKGLYKNQLYGAWGLGLLNLGDCMQKYNYY